MLWRLKYYFKTDREIRVADKREYVAQQKILSDLHDIMDEKRENITISLGAALGGIKGCFHRGACSEFTCCDFDFKRPCSYKWNCPCESGNRAFFKAQQEYNNQKQLVRNFWRTRMRERING